MPTLVLLAGPNGAGKTTFINGFLRERAEAFPFVNPDEVARGSSLFRHPPASRRLAAQTGGPIVILRPSEARTGGGAREREVVADSTPDHRAADGSPSAPPPVPLRGPEDDDGSPGRFAPEDDERGKAAPPPS